MDEIDLEQEAKLLEINVTASKVTKRHAVLRWSLECEWGSMIERMEGCGWTFVQIAGNFALFRKIT